MSQNMSQKTPIDSWKTFKRLFGYLKYYKLAFFVAVLGNLAYAGMDFLFVRSLEDLTDEVLVGGNMDIMKMAPFFIIGLLFFRGIASFISAYCMSWVGQNIVQKIRIQMAEHYMQLPSQFFDQNSSGSLVSKITFNTQQVASATTDAITKLLREGGLIIYILYYLFSTSWKLASLFMLAAPFIGIIVAFTSKRFKNISLNIQNAMGGITQNTQEVVDGYKVIKTFSGENYELSRFSKAAKKNRQQNIKMVITKAFSVPLIQLIASFSFALVVYYAGIELANNTLSPGQFVTMLTMMMMMLKPLKIISNLNSVIQQGIAAAHSLFEVLDEQKELDVGKKEVESPQGDLEFSHVTFAYSKDTVNILNDISFSVNAGQTVALVGRSGSGKSTITNLLLRFYNPQNGKILLDGVNTEDLKLDNLRKHMSIVTQQVTLFNTSVLHNIAYATDKVDIERVKDAAKKAHAWEFIEKLPKGLDENIGENGQRLSGGQRQRLAIARALYKDAPIVILDEATSALDTESERHIQEALDSLTHNKTTLVIAHRLSTVEKADCILVLDDGQIIERGTHSELLANDSFYATLYKMQFKDKPAENKQGEDGNVIDRPIKDSPVIKS